MASAETTVAEALRKAHGALLEDLRKLEEAVRPASGEGLPAVRARLGATRAHIAEHFRFEEQNGYMDVLRKREPRLDRGIDELAEEHRRLTQALAALLRQTQDSAALDDLLRDKVRQWVGCVRRHEARENDLVQDAFNQDIGAED